jgi:penicillin amidase
MTLASALFRPLLRYWARKAEPYRSESLLVPGLKESVAVRWDHFAVPHVLARNETDLFMAQGYLHAQERLWQMDFNRRFFSGRLGEVFGERAIPWQDTSVHFKDKVLSDLDYFSRLMGIRSTACASLALLPEDIVDRLHAYSDGVNRYVETHLKRLPVEFRLLRYHPEMWRPEDSLTILRGFALLLSTSVFTRLVLTAIGNKLIKQPAKLKSLYPRYPKDAPCITRSAAEVSLQALRFISGTFQDSDWAPLRSGSNNWVIGPRRSSTGKPLLCNDPHLRMTLPSVWYLMHLRTVGSENTESDFEAWGASVPGSPCVQLGHNRWIAWGVTAAICDDADLYLEKTHPGDSNCYLAGDEWKQMECREETIVVKGGKQIRRTLRFTRHGPVVSDFTQRSTDEVLAVKWTGHEPGRELLAVYGVNRARDWNEFLLSLSHQVAPTLNYVYADTSGNIGYTLAGRVPIRDRYSLLPVSGWSNEFEWRGWVPFAELPRLYNPPEGLIATANNRIVDRSYPYHLSDLFEPPYRIHRIKELLTAKEKHSLDDVIEMQKDVVSLQAKSMIEELRNDIEKAMRTDRTLKGPGERLIHWDGKCSANSPEASLSHVFHQRLMANLLGPELGEELYLAYTEIFNQALAPIDEILKDPQSAWFATRSRESLVEGSLREACRELRGLLGADMDQWSWGKLHTLIMTHSLGRSKILAPLFSLGPFPSSGDGVTINLGFYRHSNPYRHIVGPSLRMIVDLSDLPRSRFILSSGQSGHPFSPHYADQLDLWRRGDYIQLSGPTSVTASLVNTAYVVPATTILPD